MADYEIYRWKWDINPKYRFVDRVPLNLDIELTTRCIYKCIMCEHSFNPPIPMDLPIEDVKKIIDEFAEKGGAAIKFCYLGEPLLYPYLCEVIKYAKDKGIVDTIIATNGFLLNSDLAYQLIKVGLDWIIFSVDSCHPDTYESIRINGDLHIVKQNITSLFALRSFLDSEKPKIQIQAIPMKINKCEIESGQYEEYWKSYCDIVRISPYCEVYNIKEDIGETPNFFCPSIYRRFTIRADGKIALCCGTRSNDKIIGDIYKDTIEEVWKGKKMTKVRKLMNEGRSHQIRACKRCSMRRDYAKK